MTLVCAPTDTPQPETHWLRGWVACVRLFTPYLLSPRISSHLLVFTRIYSLFWSVSVQFTIIYVVRSCREPVGAYPGGVVRWLTAGEGRGSLPLEKTKEV